MVIKRVKIKHFEALDSFEEEFGKFTVVVGKTNCGKSSIVRALKKILYNDRGVPEITHTKSSCSIELEYKGKVVKWKRDSSGSILYRLEDKDFNRASNTPDEIIKFFDLKDGDIPIRVNISEQFKSMFLVNMTGSQLADMIGTLFNLERANEVIFKLDKRVRDLGSELKVNQSELESLEEPDYERVKKLSKLISDFKECSTNISSRKNELMELGEYKQILKKLEMVKDVYVDINVIGIKDDIADLAAYSKMIDEEIGLTAELSQIKDAIDKEFQEGVCPIAGRKYYKGCNANV